VEGEIGERVAVVGLGRVSRFHLEALEAIDGVDVVGGYDVDREKGLARPGGRPHPVFDSLERLLSAGPTTVIVATPTAAHFDTCSAVLSAGAPPARLLVEKPIGTSLRQVEELLAPPPTKTEIIGVYHAAHAPEVMWAAERVARWQATHGPIVGYEATFTDPYRDLDRAERDSLVDSWFDSGINALSIALRFVALRDAHGAPGSGPDDGSHQAEIRFTSSSRVGRGTIRTSWDVDAAEKHSAFRFASGALLHLDHQNMRGTISEVGRVLDSFSCRGDTPRLTLHYINAFTSLYTRHATGCYGRSDSLLLHRMLFSGRRRRRP
jgi:predicted dehydrogenase